MPELFSILASFVAVIVVLNISWLIAYRFAHIWLLLMWLLLLWATGADAGLGLLAVGVLSFIPMVIFGIRAGIADARGELARESICLIDYAISVAFGILIAGTLFRWLAWRFVGSEGALSVHLIVGAFAVVAIIAAAVLQGLHRITVGAGGLTLLALTLLSWFWYPTYVEERATAWAGDAPYTLDLHNRARDTYSRADLTFLTMNKADWGPHAVLSFETGSGTCNLGWSYGQFDFRTDNHLVNSRACPR